MKELKIDPKFLKEYRCPVCNKLLCKGRLTHKDNYLEIKCRGCKTICILYGKHAGILEMRAKFLEKGLISDKE